jgi:2-methylisocitrate lyase-like PEP mutase family enzyme
MTNQQEKGLAFKKLHDSSESFIIPNPWDQGSALMMQKVGYKALATTSAGFAQTLGKVDGEVTLDEKVEHCRALCKIVDIPVSADFENGFADSPEEAAGNILKAAGAGIVGCSIEDYSGSEIYDFDLSVERISACAEAVATLSFPFILTARSENLIRGIQDLDDTIKRLQAYEAAGADVLYAPGLRTPDQVKQVLASLNKPINVLSPFMPDVSLQQYQALGVRRISLGVAIASYAVGASTNVAKEMLESGTFSWMK